MLAVAGIILGIGIALNEKRLKELGRAELFQCIVNGIIVGALFSAFGRYGFVTQMINSITDNSLTSTSCNGSLAYNHAICFGYNYLVGIVPLHFSNAVVLPLTTTAFTLFASISGIYMALSLIQSFANGILPSLGQVVAPFCALLSKMMLTLGFAMVTIWVQAVLLKVASAVAIPVLLPIGIVLRTFYFTRKLGGAILAISIGLFAVFPLTYLLDAQITVSYSNAFNDNLLSGFQSNATNINSNILSASQITNSTKRAGIVAGISGAITNLMQQFINTLDSLSNAIAIVIVEVFFLPLLSLILTVISIREFAKILGSEVSFGRYDVF